MPTLTNELPYRAEVISERMLGGRPGGSRLGGVNLRNTGTSTVYLGVGDRTHGIQPGTELRLPRIRPVLNAYSGSPVEIAYQFHYENGDILSGVIRSPESEPVASNPLRELALQSGNRLGRAVFTSIFEEQYAPIDFPAPPPATQLPVREETTVEQPEVVNYSTVLRSLRRWRLRGETDWRVNPNAVAFPFPYSSSRDRIIVVGNPAEIICELEPHDRPSFGRPILQGIAV